MNKLLFTYKRDFNDDIVLVSNNILDLEEYILNTFNWHKVVFYTDYVSVYEIKGANGDSAELKWIKEI